MNGPGENVSGDQRWMAVALEQARLAAAAGEVPIGAAIVIDGELIAVAHNCVESLRDATAHAELLALRQASGKLDRWRLLGAELFVTVEPCPMCVMGAVLARVKRIVFGAPDLKFGGLGSRVDLLAGKVFNHRPDTTAGVLAADSAELLREFFRERRRKVL